MGRTFRDTQNTAFLKYAQQNNLLPSELIAEAKAGNQTSNDGYAVIRYNITGLGGFVKLVSSSTLQRDGVSDFNNGRLKDNLNMILKAIIIGAGSDSTETEPGKINYGHSVKSIQIPLQNAVFTIMQGNKQIKEIPVIAMVCGTESQNPIGMDSDFEFENWDFLRGDMPVEIGLRFPEGVAMPNDKKYFVEVILRGSYLERKNK